MVILTLNLIALLIGAYKSHRIINGPTDKYLNRYDSVVFECLIENYNPSQDFVEWCKNDFCTWGRHQMKSDTKLQFKSLPKYFLIGERMKGDWKLLIENVTESEFGEYKCTLTHRGNQSNKNVIKTESSPAKLELMSIL